MGFIRDMGKTEKVTSLIGAALLSLVAIAAIYYNGGQPVPADWQPLAEVLWELTTASGVAALTFPMMEWLKGNVLKDASKLKQSWVHLVIACSMAPISWMLLVQLNLTEVSPRGAVMMASATYSIGKLVWAHYKNEQRKLNGEEE